MLDDNTGYEVPYCKVEMRQQDLHKSCVRFAQLETSLIGKSNFVAFFCPFSKLLGQIWGPENAHNYDIIGKQQLTQIRSTLVTWQQ